jgi:hypothetical protein
MAKGDKQPPLYVVYPAALFHGWEVVKEPGDDATFFETEEGAVAYAEARAAMAGGGVVKRENWFGDTEDIWEVAPRAPARTGSATGGNAATRANSPISATSGGRRSPGTRR